jgi:hypothetical protein
MSQNLYGNDTFIKDIKNAIDNFMWGEFQRIKILDKPTEIEDQFRSKFYSWDRSDCSIVGMLNILLWYIASIENSDPWRQDEYKEVIKAIESIRF